MSNGANPPGLFLARAVTVVAALIPIALPVAIRLQKNVQVRIDESAGRFRTRRRTIDNPVRLFVVFYILITVLAVFSPLIFGLLGQRAV